MYNKGLVGGGASLPSLLLKWLRRITGQAILRTLTPYQLALISFTEAYPQPLTSHSLQSLPHLNTEDYDWEKETKILK